ncbi:MAG: hypothetical protein HRT66_00600 [Flavobacteriaceae bacterium]|nr:hypothetical protein [Flavobacteriaceae bacterium]
MKKICFLFILAIHQMFACDCDSPPILNKINNSDFIATAKIVSISIDEKDEDYHNIKIEIIDLFKGNKVSSMKIISVLNSSCAFYTPRNTVWLIYATKDRDGVLSFGSCYGARRIDRKFNDKRFPNAFKNNKRSVELELQLLKYLKNKSIKLNVDSGISYSFLRSGLDEFKGVEVVKERFALYELVINKDLDIIKVIPLKEFDNEKLHDDLLNCIKKEMKIRKIREDNYIKDEFKITISLFYYQSDEKYQSFISIYFL